MKELCGIIPAVITPFNDSGAFDEAAFSAMIERLSKADVNGFFIAGTTGEGPYLSTGEITQMIKLAIQRKTDNQFVCAASLRPSTGQVLEEIDAFQKAGADYLVIVPPFYYRQSNETIIAHYETIARNSSVPIIIYDIVQHTSNLVTFEVRNYLAQNKKIAGIKDSTGSFQNFSRGILEKKGNVFKWIQGDDSLYAASFMAGADAVVSGLSNIDPKPYVEMYKAVLSKEYAKVLDVQRWIFDLMEIIRVSNGKVIHSIKYAMSLMGGTREWLREKPEQLNAEEKPGVRAVLQNMKLI
ncbi:MAG: dihydrodipicolinate synthase family protein [Treponema sp.]|jgi:4-hydroxy-tetrahydrodipicolinate synthase|nr:dihydrodipicolinate synthase family protein [Treponema sp.]